MSNSILPIRDIIEAIETIHRKLAARCHELAGSGADTRMQMLLNYVADHENKLLGTLQRTRKDSRPEVLDTWFQLPAPLDRLEADMQLTAVATTAELVAQVEELDEKRLQFFQTLAAKAPTPEVRKLMEGLMALEEIEQRRLQLAALRLNDI